MSLQPHRIVRSGALSLAVYRWPCRARRRQAPVVLLVHGYPDSAEVWSATAEALSAHAEVWAYDVRGAGRSSRPRALADYRLEVLAADLAAVLTAIDSPRPVHLVGHDWGSMQSWESVCGPREQGRIASFTTLSGPSLDHVGHWARRRLRSAQPGARRALLEQLLRSWYIFGFQIPGLGALPWRLGLDRLWPRLLRRFDGPVETVPSRTRRADGCHGVALYRANVLPRLRDPQPRHCRLPVLLIQARQDRFVAPTLFDDLAQWVPRLWRREIDGGHWLPLSHPRQLAAEIERFVRFVDSGEEPALLAAARVVRTD
ncbi:MAG TPA: alpha/beta fold hydrolase [Nevskiaceae bacterium]|nr:alpha/beta fold hydrolase [Nevskiaceae bacterium]